MNRSDLLLHLLNFAAPAFALAVLTPFLSRLLLRPRSVLMPWWGQMAVNFLVGLLALLAALWWLGRDGKMVGYGLLVVAVASMQWLLQRGWRR